MDRQEVHRLGAATIWPLATYMASFRTCKSRGFFYPVSWKGLTLAVFPFNTAIEVKHQLRPYNGTRNSTKMVILEGHPGVIHGCIAEWWVPNPSRFREAIPLGYGHFSTFILCQGPKPLTTLAVNPIPLIWKHPDSMVPKGCFIPHEDPTALISHSHPIRSLSKPLSNPAWCLGIWTSQYNGKS